MTPKTLVVIPTYNEAGNIRAALDRALTSLESLEVLVVDDGSPDGTAEVVASAGSDRVHLLRRERKSGLGPAYVAGFRWGLDKGFERFVEMDGDLSHDPAALPALIAATRRADLVIGSRYVPGGKVEGWSRARHLLSKAGNLYSRLLLGFPIRDSTSGFRCYRAEVLTAIGLSNVISDGYAFQIDMAYRAWLLGFEVEEIPITFVERAQGSSKMSGAIVVEAFASVTRWGMGDLFRGRRFRTRNRRVRGGGC